MKYRRKPLEVVAEAFDPNDSEQAARLGIEWHPIGTHIVFFLATPEYIAQVEEGDWIVTQDGKRSVRTASFMVDFEAEEPPPGPLEFLPS